MILVTKLGAVTVVEAWRGDRKLTIYSDDLTLYRVWGPNVLHDISDETVESPEQVAAAWDWLHDERSPAAPVDEHVELGEAGA